MTTFMFWNLVEVSREVRQGDETHWHQQGAVVRNHHPQVLAITEGWEWHRDEQALLHRARTEFGYDHAELYASKTGCNMAVMWRDGITLETVYRQPQELAFWHGFMRVDLNLPDSERPFSLVVSHMNPFDPTLRRIEGSWLRQRLPATGHGALVMDANCIPPGDPEPAWSPTRVLPGEEVCDRAPLQTLADVGLVDVGASRGDRTPTAGYFNGDDFRSGPQVRIDQAWVTPSVTIKDYRVIDSTEVDPDIDTASDHRPIWFETA